MKEKITMNEKKRHYVINIVFTILLMITIVVFMKTSATPYSQAVQKEVHKRISNTKQKQNVEHLQQLDYAQDETRPEISHEERSEERRVGKERRGRKAREK